MGWNKFCLFPEATTTNGTSIIKFKKGAFVGMKTVQPCYLRISERMVWPGWEVTDFWVLFIFIASSLCMYNCTIYIMPEFTPT